MTVSFSFLWIFFFVAYLDFFLFFMFFIQLRKPSFHQLSFIGSLGTPWPYLCFPTHMSFSVCHLLEKMNNCSVVESQLLTVSELHLAFRRCPSWTARPYDCKNMKGQEVQCLHQPVWSVLISFGTDTPECVSMPQCSFQ